MCIMPLKYLHELLVVQKFYLAQLFFNMQYLRSEPRGFNQLSVIMLKPIGLNIIYKYIYI
jgi:hypothetical protein